MLHPSAPVIATKAHHHFVLCGASHQQESTIEGQHLRLFQHGSHIALLCGRNHSFPTEMISAIGIPFARPHRRLSLFCAIHHPLLQSLHFTRYEQCARHIGIGEKSGISHIHAVGVPSGAIGGGQHLCAVHAEFTAIGTPTSGSFELKVLSRPLCFCGL